MDNPTDMENFKHVATCIWIATNVKVSKLLEHCN